MQPGINLQGLPSKVWGADLSIALSPTTNWVARPTVWEMLVYTGKLFCSHVSRVAV